MYLVSKKELTSRLVSRVKTAGCEKLCVLIAVKQITNMRKPKTYKAKGILADEEVTRR